MEKQLNLCGVTFNFSVEGEGKPVVLMHGWGCNRTTLARIEQLLVPHFKVYNVDFPGFGKSSEPTSVWGIEDYTHLFEEFLKAEKSRIRFCWDILSADALAFSVRRATKCTN